MRKSIILLATLFIFLPAQIRASGIAISEIMYDIEGSDGGKEWIEIYNNTGNSIDLTEYKFFENGVSHGISHIQGEELLPNNSYAIIADNATNFINTWTDVSKSQIYDASFSLSNTAGEYLAIKDADGNIVYEVTYDTSLGANGDGNSLQFYQSSWRSALPSPMSSANVASNQEEDSTQIEDTNNNSLSAKTEVKKEYKMQFVWEAPKTAIVGSKVNIKVNLYGNSGEIISNGDFVWNFGDGTVNNAKNLSEVSHAYNYPGDYIVTISYKNYWNPKPVIVGKWNIAVINSPFKLTEFYDTPRPAIGITNTRDAEYDISGYRIWLGQNNLILPEGSYVGGKDEIVIILPPGKYSKEKIALFDPFENKISDFTSTRAMSLAMPPNKTVLPLEIDPAFYPEFATASIGNLEIAKPKEYKIIELPEDAPVKNNTIAYVIFLLLIVSGSITVFIIRKNNKNIDENNADDYALQDE